ncbi:hypothetical protein SASC598O02_006510 [Snodgrassella alvi SCGC AB-598-O02]|nr:hypothetical protein SASC598O02_006510 [Snodgrassella alvi SCGC AB-598-O02]
MMVLKSVFYTQLLYLLDFKFSFVILEQCDFVIEAISL